MLSAEQCKHKATSMWHTGEATKDSHETPLGLCVIESNAHIVVNAPTEPPATLMSTNDAKQNASCLTWSMITQHLARKDWIIFCHQHLIAIKTNNLLAATSSVLSLSTKVWPNYSIHGRLSHHVWDIPHRLFLVWCCAQSYPIVDMAQRTNSTASNATQTRPGRSAALGVPSILSTFSCCSKRRQGWTESGS